MSKHPDTVALPKVRGEGVEPSSPGSKPGSLPFSRSPKDNVAHLAPRVELSARGASGPQAEGEGVEPSRLVARPFSRRLPSPVGLPFRSSCGGSNRTCNRLLNREPPYRLATPQEVRTVGFEPTLSGSRNRRIPRLSYVLNHKQSTPRESNPHILHGEQAGCRYITGAKWDSTDSNRHRAG